MRIKKITSAPYGTDQSGDAACAHLARWTQVLSPVKHECEECMKTGSTWVHLRTCQTCGVTLCCDSSPHKHAHATF